jgi:hypothetical protein
MPQVLVRLLGVLLLPEAVRAVMATVDCRVRQAEEQVRLPVERSEVLDYQDKEMRVVQV